MYRVALVGPDGAGKTTVARALVGRLPMRAVYLYMGVSPDSANRLLPTTWLVRKLRRARGSAAGGPAQPAGQARRRRGLRAGVRASLRLLNRIAEESYRELLSAWYRRSGALVIYDRHFYADYYGTDVTDPAQPWSRRLHGLFLSRVYPKPDLIVYLDAPAELLFARKGEGTLASLRAQQRAYERLAETGLRFVAVDATQPLEAVVDEVVATITSFAQERAARGGLAAA